MHWAYRSTGDLCGSRLDNGHKKSAILRFLTCGTSVKNSFWSQYRDVVKAFLLFQESAVMLTWRNRFKQYSSHSLMEILFSSKIVPVVERNVRPHRHLYR